jgi:predicted metalloendopeptidase
MPTASCAVPLRRADRPRDASSAIASVDQAGLRLPDRDYYLKTDAHSVELRDEMRSRHPEGVHGGGRAVGTGHGERGGGASVETAMATAMLDRVKRRDPANTQHHMTINELQALSPSFNWRMPSQPKRRTADHQRRRARLSAREFADQRQRDGRSEDVPPLHVLHESADLLPRAFADAISISSAGPRRPAGADARWRRCVTTTDEQLGEALGKAFIDETFSPKARPTRCRWCRTSRTRCARTSTPRHG